MYITVSSSFILFILAVYSTYKLYHSVLYYHRLNSKYGDMGTYYIPSVSQARRIAQIKTYKYICYVWIVTLFISTSLLIAITIL